MSFDVPLFFGWVQGGNYPSGVTREHKATCVWTVGQNVERMRKVEISSVRFILPIFHSRIHVAVDYTERIIRILQHCKAPACKRFLQRLEMEKDHVNIGKLALNATALFKLALECV